MPHLIARLGPNAYVEWSTVVDAPITEVMTEAEIKQYIRDGEAVNVGETDELATRLIEQRATARWARVQRFGTSMQEYSVADLIRSNRAGPQETCLCSRKAIIERYSNRR